MGCSVNGVCTVKCTQRGVRDGTSPPVAELNSLLPMHSRALTSVLRHRRRCCSSTCTITTRRTSSSGWAPRLLSPSPVAASAGAAASSPPSRRSEARIGSLPAAHMVIYQINHGETTCSILLPMKHSMPHCRRCRRHMTTHAKVKYPLTQQAPSPLLLCEGITSQQERQPPKRKIHALCSSSSCTM